MAKIIKSNGWDSCDFCGKDIDAGEEIVFVVPQVGPRNNVYCMRCDKKLRDKVYTVRGN